MRLARLWIELKQRGVVSAIVIYAVIGFVVLLLADLLAPVLSFPAWLHRLLIRTALAGLPITALVAWSFDLRRQIRPVGGRDLDAIEEEERSRTSSIYKLAATITGVLALSLLIGAMFTTRESTPAVVAERVVIAPFENRTDNPELAALGAAAADLIAQRLIEAGQFDVVPFSVATAYTTVLPPSPAASLFSRAIDLARGVGAGLVVWGSYYLDHDSLKFGAQLMDARTGELLRNIATTSAPAYQVSDIVTRFGETVARTLARQTEIRLAAASSHSTPPLARAHERYVSGIQQYTGADFDSAASFFHSAAALDSSFVSARLWEARALGDGGHFAAAAALAQSVDRTKLPTYERALLDHVLAQGSHDAEARYAAASHMLAAAPASGDAVRLLATAALAVAHPREARSTLLAARPEQGWLLGWGGGYFATLALAYDQVGDYHGELRVAREGLRRFPASAESWLGVCRALAGLHRPLEAQQEAGTLQTQFDYGNSMTPGTAFLYCAQEMAAHGERRGVRSFIGQSHAWFKAHADRGLSPDARADYADVVALLHRNDEAYGMMVDVARAAVLPEERARMRARLGFIAAITGRTREARAIDQELDELPASVLTPYIELEQARIADVLGNRERAWNKLLQAVQDGLPIAEISSPGLGADYALAPLRRRPGFRALIQPRG